MRFDVRNKKPKLWNAAILTAAAAGLIAVLLIRDAEKNALAVRLEGMSVQEATEWLQTRAQKVYDAKEQAVSPDIMREMERVVLLRVVIRSGWTTSTP